MMDTAPYMQEVANFAIMLKKFFCIQRHQTYYFLSDRHEINGPMKKEGPQKALSIVPRQVDFPTR